MAAGQEGEPPPADSVTTNRSTAPRPSREANASAAMAADTRSTCARGLSSCS